MTLNDLFKNTTYDDTLFSAEAKSAIESRIFMKSVRGSEVPYVTCAIRDKEIKLTPEEAVRQLYIYKLMNDYGYATSRIQLETPIHFGREVKRADIAIMDKDRPMVPYIIVELKKPKLTDGKEQLKSYCNATGAPIGVWTNGEQISCYNRKDPNFFEEISDIPKATRKLSDIINEKFTYEDLKRKDKISTQKKSLRSLIKEMEDEVLASAGVDSFEEIFKLIFAKLYSLQSVKNLSIGMLSGVLASSTSTTMILPRFLSLFWMKKFRKILPRKCRTPLLFAVNLSSYLNMQNRLLKWPLSREKILRWHG